MSKARDIASAAPAPAGVTSTELGYIDGVTSAVQTQIDSKIGSASAINPTIVDAKGDIIAATAADTVSKLTVGANDTVLTADSSEATGLKWAAPAGGGKVLQVVSVKYSTQVGTTSVNTFIDTGLEATITPSSASSKIMIFTVCKYINTNSADQNGIVAFQLIRGATVIFKPFNPNNLEGVGPQAREVSTLSYIDSPSTTSATTYKLQGLQKDYISSGGRGLYFQTDGADSSMILMEIGA
jgi:hypothetical protein